MEKKEEKKKTPLWGWAFGLICLTIPVVSVGGMIPSILGGLGFISCYGISRDGKGSESRRIINCSIVTGFCWILFVTLIFLVESHQSKQNEEQQAKAEVAREEFKKEIEAARAPKVLTLDEEKAIYAETLSKREGIVALESEIKTHLAEGRNTDVLLKQLVHRQVSHKRGMDFTAKFHRITPEKLQEIIARGDAEAWAATE